MTGRLRQFTARLKQTAVYWPRPTSDGYGGWTFTDPTELLPASHNGVRWEDRQERYVDAQGKDRVSRAVVIVAQDLQVGGFLYLGELDDLDTGEQADPQTVADAHEIMAFSKIPNKDADDFWRQAWL